MSDESGYAVKAGVRDVRAPAERLELIERLTEHDRPFPSMRDVLVFAAAVGWSQGRSESFEKSIRDRIRWSTMTNRTGTEDLINMIAVAETSDANILSPDRFGERIRIFEEYANGGLIFIENLIASQPHRDLITLLAELVRTGLDEGSEDDLDSYLPDEVSRLAKELL
ncbi:DNA phosphorothioation-associated protein 4 [Actinomadura luteofluorescens]|uniref:Dnd system-associated protein 4 n=1 Tax=Actinomadura luteofluorescens TaxID=46163 RepID=A0A7Y9EJ20_9ACTN|nr:DNA phosphorothioation-associated protein 4 [Actinomadura luteofluorescens]NYD48466.1 dnd system-associated protein 4 [Actinomadura luteofluorescens]